MIEPLPKLQEYSHFISYYPANDNNVIFEKDNFNYYGMMSDLSERDLRLCIVAKDKITSDEYIKYGFRPHDITCEITIGENL